MFKTPSLLTWSLILLAFFPIGPVEAGPLICAGNLPPDGMVITATGTADQCPGACRARDIQPAQQAIMVICASQPVPDEYELESFTSVPACECVGDRDNAYVIRRTVELGDSP
jgi:hypothetical protein